MDSSHRKLLIFAFLSVLVIALVFDSFSPYIVFALPRDPSNPGQGEGCEGTISLETGDETLTCCWTDKKDGKKYCQKCTTSINNLGRYETNCDPKVAQGRPLTGDLPQLEQVTPPILDPVVPQEGIMQAPAPSAPSSPPPLGEGAPPQDGVLEQPLTPPPSGPAAPLQDGEVTRWCKCPPCCRAPEADQGTGAAPRIVEPPSTADEATPCPEGQVLDEESCLCVLEEPEEQPAEEGQQPSEESDSEGNNDNN
jgi:hypothetical protein